MQVSEVMHRGIVSANANDTIKHVAELMKKEGIGAIPIVDDSGAVGLITDRDIVIKCVASGADLANTPVRKAMTEDVTYVKESDQLEKVTLLMEQKQVSRVVVIDEAKKPIGIVSLRDLSEADENLSEEALQGIKSDHQGGVDEARA